MIQILELFGGIGAPRAALRNLGVPTKSIDYVEIDEKCVRSYNAMFREDLGYKPQSVIGYSLMPSVLFHGSPCQDMSCAGHQGPATAKDGRINRGRGAEQGSGTRSSLMWETISIIRNLGVWKPRVCIWENVPNTINRYNKHNFDAYIAALDDMGYVNSYSVLDCRDFEIPQARQRLFVVSILGGPAFDFGRLEHKPMRSLHEYLLDNSTVPTTYDVVQPSILSAIGKKGIRRATVITDYAYTITCRQDRTPAQIIDCGGGRFRYLTEKECWRLQGYTDEDFERAKSVHTKKGKHYSVLYHQAGNSIPVTMCEAIFKILLEDQII